MPKATPLINNFNAGEISPTIDTRSDLQKYYSGCRTMENFFPLIEGGAKRMPGTYFVAYAKYVATVVSASISASVSPTPTPSVSISKSISASVSPSASISPSPSAGAPIPPVAGPGTGTRADPYKLNVQRIDSGYSFSDTGIYSLAAGAKIYFEVDPYTYLGVSRTYFRINLKGYNNPNFTFWHMCIEKTTGNLIFPEGLIPSASYAVNRLVQEPPDIDLVRYVYAVQNTGSYADRLDVWWQ